MAVTGGPLAIGLIAEGVCTWVWFPWFWFELVAVQNVSHDNLYVHMHTQDGYSIVYQQQSHLKCKFEQDVQFLGIHTYLEKKTLSLILGSITRGYIKIMPASTSSITSTTMMNPNTPPTVLAPLLLPSASTAPVFRDTQALEL